MQHNLSMSNQRTSSCRDKYQDEKIYPWPSLFYFWWHFFPICIDFLAHLPRNEGSRVEDSVWWHFKSNTPHLLLFLQFCTFWLLLASLWKFCCCWGFSLIWFSLSPLFILFPWRCSLGEIAKICAWRDYLAPTNNEAWVFDQETWLDIAAQAL